MGINSLLDRLRSRHGIKIKRKFSNSLPGFILGVVLLLVILYPLVPLWVFILIALPLISGILKQME